MPKTFGDILIEAGGVILGKYFDTSQNQNKVPPTGTTPPPKDEETGGGSAAMPLSTWLIIGGVIVGILAALFWPSKRKRK